ncbi:ABC transporter ATP-binding protein [Pararhizobium mangrovi]|uniref:ABC transporter ATP-binding protein n=2 Tax=Pararhizobium mangrovi TaxID=2590452 RepID=A0A506TWR2_9HYPH|nr:ABC transporter ATP-binding protein [Pararhizobium mangrovi]
MRDYTGTYVFAIGCLAVTAASTAFTAWIMKDVVNEAFAKQNASLVWIICLSILAAFVARGFASYGQAVALSKVGNNIIARYQRRLYDHLMRLSVGYFSDWRSAQISARISQNVNGIRDVMNLTVTSIARDLLTLVALVCVMVARDPFLSALVFLVGPPVFFALRYIAKRLRVVTREAVIVNSQVLGNMQESIQGIAIVKAFTMEDQLSARADRLIGKAERQANRIVRLTQRTTPLTECLAGIAISGVLAYAAYNTIYRGILPGSFFSFITALLLAYDPARKLARLQVTLERAAVNARMIYEILDTEPHQKDAPGARDIAVSGGEIVVDGVSFGYAGTGMVLKNVSFTAEPGRMTALVGPSGAGKSTLIALLLRFYDPNEGAIRIDGQDIAGITKRSLREKIAYVSQQPYLFEGTIRDNLRYGRADATDAEIEEAAKLAYAHDFIMEQPQGYDTPVGENGVTLSGGQRQRVSIARALVRNAPILLLDEATSALDTESEAIVQKALDHAMEGRTVVVIAHRLSTIARADRIIVMQSGRIAEQGRHEDLAQRSDGIYARFHRMQALGLDTDVAIDQAGAAPAREPSA